MTWPARYWTYYVLILLATAALSALWTTLCRAVKRRCCPRCGRRGIVRAYPIEHGWCSVCQLAWKL